MKFVAAAALLVCLVHAADEAKKAEEVSDVKTLNTDNFKSVVLDPTKDVMVKFYAKWCGACKAMKPAYQKVATHYKSSDSVVIAHIEKDDALGEFEKYGVTGFPSIQFFLKEAKDKPVKFEYPREPEIFQKWIDARTKYEWTPPPPPPSVSDEEMAKTLNKIEEKLNENKIYEWNSNEKTTLNVLGDYLAGDKNALKQLSAGHDQSDNLAGKWLRKKEWQDWLLKDEGEDFWLHQKNYWNNLRIPLQVFCNLGKYAIRQLPSTEAVELAGHLKQRFPWTNRDGEIDKFVDARKPAQAEL